MIFDGCLLVSDLDHTLVEIHEVSRRSLEAIDYFKQNGGKFGIATGRHQLTAEYFNDLARANCAAITFGSAIYDYNDKKPIWYEPIKDETKRICLELMEEHPQLGAMVFTMDDIYIVRQTDATDYYKFRVDPVQVLDADISDVMDKKWVRFLFACMDAEWLIEFEKKIKARNYDNFDALRSESWLYEINSCADINKGSALEKLGEHLGIDREKIFAIGDYYNDVPMLVYAGKSATVADADDEIKKLVDFVGGRCLDGAVADFIEYIENTVKEK